MSIFLDSDGMLAGRARAAGQTTTYIQSHPQIVGDSAGLAGQAVGGNDTIVSAPSGPGFFWGAR